MMDWNNLRLVLAVADGGGLSAAGRVLGLDPGTIGRRLDAMEADLGCKLFHRSRRGLMPTGAGLKLVARARRIDEEVRALGLELSPEDRGLQGVVTITATEVVSKCVLAPSLRQFRERHAGITLEIVSEIRKLDLGRREADIALRLTRPEEGDLRVRRLGSVAYALYGTSAYFDAFGPVNVCQPNGLEGHAIIDWPESYTVIPQVPWLRSRAGNARVVLRSCSAVTRLACVRAGLGLALLPCMMADQEAGLVRLPMPEEPPAQDLWLVTHRDLANVPKVRVTLDFISDVVRRMTCLAPEPARA